MKNIDYLSTLFVGIDIGSRTNVVSAIDFDQNFLIKMEPFPNTQTGAEFPEERIAKILDTRRDLHSLIIGMESTGFYGVHIANYLSTSEVPAAFSTHVYCINPKDIKACKATFTAIEKDDGIDSYVIADYARAEKIHVDPWRGSQYLSLQRLTRHRLHLSECIAREKTYMLNNIFLKYSEFAMLRGGGHPFSNKYGATAEAVLTEFLTNEELMDMSLEDLVEFIDRKSRRRISDPEQTADLLKTALRNSYRLDKSLYEPITTSIACSFNCLRAFERERKAIDTAIMQTVRGLNPTEYTILTSVPGIGPVFAAGILAEIGTIHCFSSNDALAKYCGIVWKKNQSSEFEAEDTPMNKAGNRYLRYFIIEAASSVINHCPEYKAFYEKKYKEVTKHQHKRALALIYRKLIRMLYGLLDKGQLCSVEKSR